MSGPLRHIALTVEQTARGGYGWLLIESAGGRVFVLKKGERYFGSYLGALDAGYQELALLSACGLHGRAADEDNREPEASRIELAELHDAI